LTLCGVLGEPVFGMIKNMAAFGNYNHRKKEKGMVGTKIMATVERKLGPEFCSLNFNFSEFDKCRLTHC
jgi:hypothetical protein